MPDRVEVMVPAWDNVSFAVHRLTEAERATLRKIRDAKAFTEQLLTLSVRFWRDGVRVWSDDWLQHNAPLRAPSTYPAADIEPLLTAALEINDLSFPTEP